MTTLHWVALEGVLIFFAIISFVQGMKASHEAVKAWEAEHSEEVA